MDKQKGRKIPMQAPKPQFPQREQFVHHPEFKERIAKEMDGVEFPKEKIPADFDKWLQCALLGISFPSLGMPLPFYYQLITVAPDAMTFGLLQKACDIVFNSKPNDHSPSTDDLEVYYNMITQIATMKDALSDITDPIRDKVIDDLMAAEKIKNSGLVTG